MHHHYASVSEWGSEPGKGKMMSVLTFSGDAKYYQLEVELDLFIGDTFKILFIQKDCPLFLYLFEM